MGIMDSIISESILKPARGDKSITNYKYRKPDGPHSADYCEKVGCDCSKVLELKHQKRDGKTVEVYCRHIDNNCMIFM